MRFIRMIFVVLLAVVLIAVALANREMVVLNLFPANFGAYLGGQWSVELPLFLVIFIAVAFGMLAGLLWEYLREAQIRREAKRRSAEVTRLEREVGSLRQRHASPRDDVLAILDRPKSSAASGAQPSPTNALTAPR